MEIKINTKLFDLIKYLKNEYNLSLHGWRSNDFKNDSIIVADCNTSTFNKLNNKIFFTVTGSTTAGELVRFIYDESGTTVEIRNNNSVKLSDITYLEDGINLPAPPTQASSVVDDINNVMKISNSGSYSDWDWTFRVLAKAAYKSTDTDEKWLVINALISLAEMYDDFSIIQGKHVIDQCFLDRQNIVDVYNLMINSKCSHVVSMATKLESRIQNS